MSLNWREIDLIASELPLVGSMIQRVHQIGFNALVFEMHHPHEGPWELYVEVGTPAARLHRIGGPGREYRKRKTEKLQRFIQFMRAHIEGKRIVAVSQPGRDRLLVWKLSGKDATPLLILRFYSGPGANVIVCDEDMTIRELLFRRPGRQESAGNPLELPSEAQGGDDGRFPVREHPSTMSFNRFIEDSYRQSDLPQQRDLPSRIAEKRDAQLALLREELAQARYRQQRTDGFETYRISGDLLAANRHLISERSEWISVDDFTNSEQGSATIALDPKLSAGENIEAYYRKYRKAKTAWELASAEVAEAGRKLEAATESFEQMLRIAQTGQEAEIRALEESLRVQESGPPPQRDPYRDAPGLRFTSGQFVILVGRNAKENDALLRRWARGNDWWMHTRDTPGGYVFIKSIAGKTIPLETILDAANLALLYSKAKDSGKADLYYTQVKHLKRPKGGKTGLVLPTQEKNLTVQMDEVRIKRLFSTKKESPS